jgi:hypothetical protein
MKIQPIVEKVFEDIFERTFFEYTKNRFFSDEEIDDLKKCFYESMRNFVSKQDIDESGSVVSVDFTNI